MSHRVQVIERILGANERLAADNGIDGVHFWAAHSADIVDPPQYRERQRLQGFDSESRE